MVFIREALSGPAPVAKKYDMADLDGISANLEDYSIGLNSINFEKLGDILKGRFTNEPLIAADIRGSSGTAALDLENLGCACTEFPDE